MSTINRLAQLSLFFIFLVILAGSVVRMTGSGMGCPDWPKCFGYMIPPTDEAQVMWEPNRAFKKGQMILREEALWSANTDFTSSNAYDAANWTRYDKHDYATFDVTHTWIEYINRLIGALSGLPILAMFIVSLFHIKQRTVLAAGTLFMLVYEAWLGKLVVDGNLVPNAITKHMFGSMVIVALLITIISRTHQSLKKEVKKTFKVLVVTMLILLSLQILLGTQVREQIDEVAKITADRHQWIGMLDSTILIHRSSSILIFILSVWLFWRNWRNDYAVHAVGLAFLFIVIEIVVGAVMYYINVPKFLQPVHLLLSIGAFALLVWALLRTKLIEKSA